MHLNIDTQTRTKIWFYGWTAIGGTISFLAAGCFTAALAYGFTGVGITESGPLFMSMLLLGWCFGIIWSVGPQMNTYERFMRYWVIRLQTKLFLVKLFLMTSVILFLNNLMTLSGQVERTRANLAWLRTTALVIAMIAAGAFVCWTHARYRRMKGLPTGKAALTQAKNVPTSPTQLK